jgi:hypothetical protein
MKKGDLSKFIEEAVRWRVFQKTVEDIKARNADSDPDEIQRIVDEAVAEVRAERRARKLRKIPRNSNISRRGAEAQRQQGK